MGIKKNMIASILCFMMIIVPLTASVVFAEDVIFLTIGAQKTISVPNMKRIAIGNPQIADVKAFQKSNQILVTGVGVGTTDLLVWKKNGTQQDFLVKVTARDPKEIARELKSLLQGVEGIQIKTLGDRVVIDGNALKEQDLKKISKIVKAYPQVMNLTTLSPVALDIIIKQINKEFENSGLDTIRAERLANQIIISGDVPKEEDKKKADMIASAFEVKTMNFVKVGISLKKMIIVKVDFVEIEKGSLTEVGINWGDTFSVTSDATGAGGFGPGDLSYAFQGAYGLKTTYAATLNAIKGNQKAHILAQPKLLCRSGEKAEFVAGGEVAIPMVTMTTASVEYKTYGIILSISPVVDKSDHIATAIKIENSTISDFTDGKPNFQTSRVNTSINVKSGQTIVLSGLISNTTAKAIDKMPGLGSIPVLGELFKSRSFRNDKSELFIMVTPEVMNPDDKQNQNLIEKTTQKMNEGKKGFNFELMD